MSIQLPPEPVTTPESRRKQTLLVFVPGMRADMSRWESLFSKLKSEESLSVGTCEWLIYDPKARPLGGARLKEMVRELVARIHCVWLAHGGFDRVVLMGHSIGGMIVRAAYVAGRGYDPEVPQAHAWAGAVQHIVLLASPNRGLERLAHPLLEAGDWLLRQVPQLFATYMDVQRGSNFVTNLRINWIRLFSSKADGSSLASVIQLLGTQDSVVSRSDSIDVLAFGDTLACDVPEADHDHIGDLDCATSPTGRYLLIRTAILDPSRLGVSIGPSASAPRAGVESVVVILHGIRDSTIAKWLRAVTDEVRKVYGPGVEVVRPSYGYFSALSFVLPSVRRKNIRHFQDAYTEALARYPKARFDFIGHSNGTYMLGESLRDIAGMKFINVVLAGSVLPPNYPWDGKLGYQVVRVRSERGRLDWPVGWLCSALNGGLGMSDVGTGGYTGFTRGNVEEEKYHPGGHGSMFSKGNIPRMVRWANGQDPGPPLDSQTEEWPVWGLVSRLCPHLVRVALLLFIGPLGYLLWTHSLVGIGVVLLVLYLVSVILDVL